MIQIDDTPQRRRPLRERLDRGNIEAGADGVRRVRVDKPAAEPEAAVPWEHTPPTAASEASVPAFPDDGIDDFLASSPGWRGTIIECRRGEWLTAIDEIPIPVGTRYLFCAVTEAWFRFSEEGQPPGIIRKQPGQPLPTRDQLGGQDPAKRRKGPSGEPSDPFVHRTLVSLREVNSGGEVVFRTSSVSGRRAVADLCNAIKWRRRDLPSGSMAVIEIGVRKYQHAKFGRQLAPSFKIVSWVDVRGAPLAAEDLLDVVDA